MSIFGSSSSLERWQRKIGRERQTQIDLIHLWKSMKKLMSVQYMIKYTILPMWRVILYSDHF